MRKYIGWIIVGTLLFYLLSLRIPHIFAVPTLLAWLVPIVMWPTLGRGVRYQTVTLTAVGGLALLFSAHNDVFLGLHRILAVNVPLLAMFVAVAFLGMTTMGIGEQTLPKGRRAVVNSALGTHLLSAIINLSVLFVFGDRLQKNGRLTGDQLIILARSFCSAAWWSPFFIATGVALTYAPGMSWRATLVPGVAMSAIALGYTIIEVCFFKKEEFSGYPLRVESLYVPVLLAAAVLSAHYIRPEISVLNIICVLSPTGAILLMRVRPRIRALYVFIDSKLVSVSSQFALFLAAGVFSTGLKSLTHVYPAFFSLSSPAFTPTLFSATLAMMILIGIIGVHPVVSISIVSPLLLPLGPDPSQLGFLFLSTWAISTGSSPLSGVGLALVSRYRASPGGIIRSNWHYAVSMWGGASLMNLLLW